MKSFKKYLAEMEAKELPVLSHFIRSSDVVGQELLVEGKWVQRGIKKGSVRIDQPTHGAGQVHAHLYARNGHQYGVVNLDGTGSHGTKSNSRIQDDHADVLRRAGFSIPPNNLVEWSPLPNDVQLLLEGL